VTDPESFFTDIYQHRRWGDPAQGQSCSGPGSSAAETEAIRAALPGLLEELGCRSLLDVPCGDFFWMQLVPLEVQYLGGDIVADMVRDNIHTFSNDKRMFFRMDIIKDPLPRADLLLCRDCLVHLSYAHIFSALRNIFESECKYLLTTTFPKQTKNADITTGSWRPINLQLHPFGLPAPTSLIAEPQPPDGTWQDKSLGLWDLVALRRGKKQ